MADERLTTVATSAHPSAAQSVPNNDAEWKKSVDRLGRFHGIWLSKNVLVIGTFAVCFLVGLGVLWAHNRPADRQHPAPKLHANVPPPVPEPGPVAEPRPDIAVKKPKPAARRPDTAGPFKPETMQQANAEAAQPPKSIVVPASPFELTFDEKKNCTWQQRSQSDRNGAFEGSLYNGNRNLTVTKAIVVISTTKWTREHVVELHVRPLTTHTYFINVGEVGLQFVRGELKSMMGTASRP